MDAPTLTPPCSRPRAAGRSAPTRPSWNWRREPPARAVGGSLHRPALAVLLLVRSGCACGGSSRGCPTATTPTRPRISCPRAIALFAHDFNPHYFLNPPAFTYLLHIVFDAAGSAAGGRRARLRDRPDRRCSCSPGVVAGGARDDRGLAALPGGRAVLRPPRRPARRGAPRRSRSCRSSTAHLALNDVPTLAPVCLALFGHRAACCAAAGSRDYALAGRRARAGLRDQVHRRDRAAAAARGVRAPTPRAARCAHGRRPAAARWRWRSAWSRSWSPTRTRCSTSGVPRRAAAQPSLAAGEDAGQARASTAGQRHRLLPVDVHLGPGLGARAGRARRRDPADRPRRDRGACCVLLPAPIAVHHLHGRPAALLRPLADADLPDRGAARRLRRRSSWSMAGAAPARARRARRAVGRGAAAARRALVATSTTTSCSRAPTRAT